MLRFVHVFLDVNNHDLHQDQEADLHTQESSGPFFLMLCLVYHVSH